MGFWEWFTLITGIIGGVAFLMAVQPFTQFIWGRPNIKIEFTARDKGATRYLDILLWHFPIDNPILKLLGVCRMTAEEVALTFSVRDIRTNKRIVENAGASLSTARDENSLLISFPASIFPASFTLIRSRNGETILVHGEKDEKVTINPGKYEIDLTVHYSGNHITKKGRFSVGTQPYELFWESVKS